MKNNLVSIIVGALCAAALLGPALPAQAAGVNLLVDDDGAQCPTATFTSISAAVGTVLPGTGGTITVCAGTYAETVSISGKANLKLIARGPAVVIPPAAGFTGAIFDVSGSTNVTIQGFVVDGFDRISTSGFPVGISYSDSSGTITGNTVTRLRDAPVGTSTTGHGIYAYGTPGGTPFSVKITNNTITDFQGYGIYLVRNVKATVSKNAITMLATGGNFPAGIMLITVPVPSTVSGNIIEGNVTYAPGSARYGIYLHESQHITVSGNTIRSVANGIDLYNACSAMATWANKIMNNRITDSGQGIDLFGIGPCLDGMLDNIVKGNTIVRPWYSATRGVSLVGGAFTTHNTVSGNTFQGFATDPTMALFDGGSGTILSGNKILMNTPGS